MKLKSLLLSLIALLALCSCSHEKEYTITGTLDLPDQIPYGDTIITVPSFDGTWVYLLNFDNQLVDSVQIADKKFTFSGKVDDRKPYYVQLACELGRTLLVIEPGDILVYFDDDITVSGTPSNDAMADVDAAVENLNSDTYEYLSQLTDSLRQTGQELTEQEQMRIANDFQNALTSTLDSIYEQNKDNLGAAYAVLMRNVDVQSSELFEKAISYYPEEIRNNELLQYQLNMLRQYESMQQMDSTNAELDSLLIDPEGASAGTL